MNSKKAMKSFIGVLFLFTFTSSLCSAIPKSGEDNIERTNRVIDKDLSDQEHFDDGEHNAEYDHEAFLGKDEAKSFDQLSPEESKQRLGEIYDKIDDDHDGKVTKKELTKWIEYVQKRYVREDSDRQWKDHDTSDGLLDWESYKNRTYGEEYEQEDSEEDEQGTHRNMVSRDEKRWKKADQNNDGKLNKEEFADFLHPEDVKHMQDIVIDETLQDIDKNKDGKIDLEEYIGDMWSEKSGESEPDWVKTEREQFSEFRDKDKNGYLERDEVKDWIMPSEYDHSEAETNHLFTEADADEDGFLSKAEVLEKSDLFVGSQATDFGEALTKHDEF